jgi:hypothetical protein
MYGIGITTYNRPECIKALVDSIYKHTDMSNVLLHIEDDSIERLGVAKRKNNCLRALKDCSHVFLLDDDVKIIKDGWVEWFIENAKEEHVMFLNPLQHNPFEQNGKFIAHHDCGGVFLFLTKKHIEMVGAFNEKYELWGMEHCDYSMRIAGCREFLMLVGTEDYIYSEDYSNPNHKSSITNEEKDLLFKKNFPKFANGIDKIYIPL